jgi:mRNA-degrading endonuclease RelE of RelBE toxin-antitoxin system
MTFRVLLSETAVRQLRTLPPDVRKRNASALRVLE